jgi:2-keto-4-pentenoate hydratase/2-oxohepta-3-ene-1,7-dioic acid hydratase in catechol pathway
VRAHQAPGVQPPSEHLDDPREQGVERFPVEVIAKDEDPARAARRDMEEAVLRELGARNAWHVIDGSAGQRAEKVSARQSSHFCYRDCPWDGSDRVMAVLPIERPQKIVCIGLNYRDHAEEQGVPLPERPLLFAKWPNTLIGPGEPIRLPSISREVDYEAELAVVIGTRVRQASPDTALEAVRGYLCANDVSGRDVQFADKQWVRGKSFDTFCPVGPELVPAADVPDPQALTIRAILNGEVMQDSTTANMVFGVAEIVSFVSQAITLEPGDLILTGTPAGVGVFRDPKVLLKPGDEITIEIEGLGALTNPVEAAG